MARISQTFLPCVALIAPFTLINAAITIAAPTVAICAPATQINAPVIQKVTRSERKDGVWHDVFVEHQGSASQKLMLTVSWDANTPAEDGKGTATSKSQAVQTDAKGSGQWKMEVKGYPAGDMIAVVKNEKGQSSEPSPVFEVPWIY